MQDTLDTLSSLSITEAHTAFQNSISMKGFLPIGCLSINPMCVSEELFIDYCRLSFPTQHITNMIESLEKYDFKFLKSSMAENILDIICMAQWYLVCVKYKKHLPTLKF